LNTLNKPIDKELYDELFKDAMLLPFAYKPVLAQGEESKVQSENQAPFYVCKIFPHKLNLQYL
jgi:hypothetical protein